MQAKKVAYLALLLIWTVVESIAQQSHPVRSHGMLPQGAAVQSNYGNVPLMFEANQGQADGQIKYLSHGSNYSVYLKAGGMLLALHPSGTAHSATASAAIPEQNRLYASPIHQRVKAARKRSKTVIAVDLVGAARNPRIAGEDRLVTKVNYFIGRDPSKWRRNVPTYSRIRYSNVYSGIDLVYYGNNHKIEYDFDLAPGADPAKIQFSVAGADSLAVDSQGKLVLTKAGETLEFQMPVIYQEIAGKKALVTGTYTLRDATHVGFVVGNYDRTKPLVIDPVLVYSSFLGGSSDNFGLGVAVDSLGRALVTGITDSPDFPPISTPGPSQFQMFLSKFGAAGSSLLFTDYFGGTSGGDEPYAVALDGDGNVYIAGCSTSSDFPLVSDVPPGPYHSTFSGSQDAFLVKFTGDGSSIVYSTYFGGANLTSIGGSVSQIGTSVSVDSTGEAVVAGFTTATDFPTTTDAYQSAVFADQFNNWGEYGFVTKFAPDGASLIYSTYLAGSTYNVSSCDGCFPMSLIMGAATDADGNAYVTGWTNTADFPTTEGAFIESSPADPLSDIGFVSKLTTSGDMAYSTYLGGTASELNAIAVDGDGSAYVTGYASADDGFPTNITAICDPSAVACNGVVVAKLAADGASPAYSTFLGTSNNMMGQAIQVDADGNAFVVGSDVQFDLWKPIEQYVGNGDVVIAEVDSTGSTLLMSTFLGGQGLDTAADSLAIDADGAVYVTGVTESSDFPVTPSAFQTTLSGQTGAFIAKIDPTTNGPAVAMVPYSLQFASQDVGTTSGSQTSILRNMSSSSLTITNKNITGDFAETDDCGATVAAASQCTFTISFTPAASGERSGTLTVSDDGKSQTVTLTGTGTDVSPQVIVSPSTLSFEPLSVGTTSSSQIVTFINNGNEAVVVSEVQVTGAFTNSGSDCGSVPAQSSCTVEISFAPTVAGPLTGAVTFANSAGADPMIVSLQGDGLDFVTTSPSSSTTIAPGETATYEVNVSPAGGAFSETIQMTCSGAPAYATCQVTPSSITPGSSSSSATVTVRTSGPTAHAQGGSVSGTLPPSVVFMPFAVGILLISAGNRRKLRIWGASSAVMVILLLAGCGGPTTGKPVDTAITPPGSYSLTVTASSGNLQHVTKLTLVVR